MLVVSRSLTVLLARYPVEVEAVDEGAHGVPRGVRHQTFIQHFLHESQLLSGRHTTCIHR